MELECKICGLKFSHEKEAYCIRAIVTHLREVHQISKYDYTVTYLRNGEIPTCKCGCGKPVKIMKGWNVFNDYYSATHTIRTKESIQAGQIRCKEYYNSKTYIYKTYGKETLLTALLELKEHKKTLHQLSDELNIDCRTLKRVWKSLNLISDDDLKKLSRYNQVTKSRETAYINNLYEDDIYVKMHELLVHNPQKYTINSLVTYFNETLSKTFIKTNRLILKTLVQLYGNEIYALLQYGYHSKEELDFFNILSHYFGKENVKLGKSFYVGKTKRDRYDYDICIKDKLIIEYNGRGYFHSSEEKVARDLEKKKYAELNGYKIIYASNTDVKNIEFLLKIKNLLND